MLKIKKRELKMGKTYIPEGYISRLSIYDTQKAIELIKSNFAQKLSEALNLCRISAPLFVGSNTGINDDLNGTERPVRFDIKSSNTEAVVVHSLAKWKRLALWKYEFKEGEGMYTDMNAIRRDEDLDNLHSVYTDQWDWEKVITKENRTTEYLQKTVSAIVGAICDTLDIVKSHYPQLTVTLERDVCFITSQELEDKYPTLDSKQREYEITKEKKTVFISQIGDKLRSGKSHDGRAPDYDDWTLNGDILFWDDVLDCQIELSSMGIRVDRDSLISQLEKANATDRLSFYFHSLLADGTLPLTMGGGIGQSRLCMLLLEKAHIGEVQSSIWDDVTIEECKKKGVNLL